MRRNAKAIAQLVQRIHCGVLQGAWFDIAMHQESPTLTVTERVASTYLGMSVPWLRQGRQHGRGPAYVRIGRSVRYLVSDLEAWLQAHRVEPRDSQQVQR